MSKTSLGEGKVIRATEMALRIELESGDVLWIPKSIIHDDSEVYDEEHGEGEVVVLTWWAEKEGLA